ncbi:transposase [Sphingomonas xinjiangensis]|uniref:Transposase n=1 Tax=Sphingomonas xinjiangensis TaxID=643568 RepID=A0A840YT97_9SPHN|nr:transposase [Sphingomonas xinjiangensis]
MEYGFEQGSLDAGRWGDARRSGACQLLMTVPGVGVVTATSFITAIEDPAREQRRGR